MIMKFLSSNNKKNQQKQNRKDPIVAIDIGTYNIRFIVGSVQADGYVEVLYYKEDLSSGMVAGSVADLDLLAKGITNLVQNFQEELGLEWHSCVLGMAGRYITSFNSHGNTTIIGDSVSALDKKKAIENACAVRFGAGEILLHGIPQHFTVNGQSGILNPIGLSAPRIDVSVHMIVASVDQRKNLQRAISLVSDSVHVEKVIYNGIAAADAVLTDSEKEIGVGVIDLGEGTVNVAIYDQKQLIISFGLVHCGDRIRREIAQSFGISLKASEGLKHDACATVEALAETNYNGYFTVPGDYEYSEEMPIHPIRVQATDVIHIIEDNLADTFRSVRDRIEDIVSQDTDLSSLNLGAGFVLTGGMANMPGIELLASRNLSTNPNMRVNVRVGIPRGVVSNDEETFKAMQSPSLATAIGLLRHTGKELNEVQDLESQNKASGSVNILSKIKKWWSSEF